MINIDSLTLKFWAEENKEFLTNAHIQKIQQPTRKDLILTIRNLGETKKLYLNINPELYHLCFMDDKNKEKRHISIPQAPPMFCMLLRKYLEGARIKRISVPKYERIFEIYTEYYNELSEKIELCLATELMGKYSNIILYNTDTNVIIGCAHNIGSEKSRERELAGGYPYIYPKLSNKKDLLESIEKNENIQQNLSENFHYISQALEKQYNTNFNDIKILKELLLGKLTPTITNDNKDFSLLNIPNSETKENINSMLDDYYSFHTQKIMTENTKKQLLTKINKNYKKYKTLLEKQENELSKGEKSEIYKKKADLIMANLYNLKNFSKKITLKDFETNSDIEIEMDETKSAIENSNKYYKLYNKAKNAYIIATERIETTKNEIKKLEDDIFFISICNTIKDLEEIKENYTEQKQILKKKQEITIENKIINGLTIYIGKNNKQNDYIYSKISSPEDIWFHALNTTGAHILIKIPKGQKIDDDTILECAKLAKLYSTSKNENKARIIYTQRKNLKRPPNTPMGYVTYKNEKEIIV